MMEKVVTDDGSITYRNEEVDECYHTKSGALEESLKKHVLPSNILDNITDDLVIGDICFGLGYNSIVALSKIWAKQKELVQLFAFENDFEIMNELKNLELPVEYNDSFEKIKLLVDKKSEIEKTKEYFLHAYVDEELVASLYVGDVIKTIKNISDETFNVVFFDPFSPKKHPHLWSIEIFKEMYRTMKKGSVLTTYSCARLVRDNMREAGFEVVDGPVVGRRSPSTLAYKK